VNSLLTTGDNQASHPAPVHGDVWRSSGSATAELDSVITPPSGSSTSLPWPQDGATIVDPGLEPTLTAPQPCDYWMCQPAYNFQVFTSPSSFNSGTGSSSPTCFGLAANNTSGSWQVPAGCLQDGQTYYWTYYPYLYVMGYELNGEPSGWGDGWAQPIELNVSGPINWGFQDSAQNPSPTAQSGNQPFPGVSDTASTTMPVYVVNQSPNTWSTSDTEISYHVYDLTGTDELVAQGAETPLPIAVAPGGGVWVNASIASFASEGLPAGSYLLEFDVVATWTSPWEGALTETYSQYGASTGNFPILVTSPPAPSSPASGSDIPVGTGGPLSATLQASTCTGCTSYQFQLSTRNDFGAYVVTGPWESSPSWTVPSADLEAGATYYWEVAGRDQYDSGSAWSSASTFVTPTTPGSPTGVTAAAGPSRATVSWTAPASNGGSAITGYSVVPSLNGMPQAAVGEPAGTTSATLSGLTNGGAYTFTVAAQNAMGTGVASAPATLVAPSSVPGAPGGVTAIGGNDEATVSWQPAAVNGTAITGYTVTAYRAGAAVSTASVGGSATSAIMSGLTNGTAYTFSVEASNADGSGATASQTSAVTPGPAPQVSLSLDSSQYARGQTATITATVSPSGAVTGGPTAALSVTPSSGAATLAVTASASGSTAGSHAISTYTFNFGDGTTVGPQATATATHSYTKGGVYAATVTVTDTAGLTSTATSIEYVGQPAAELSVLPSSGTAPLAVVANGGGSTDPIGISSYTFNFGDGTTVGPQAGATAAHTYASAGTYTVTLTVKDQSGASATGTATVTVAAASGGKGTPAFVQGAAQSNGKTEAFPKAVAAGDLLVIGITTNDSGTDPVTGVSDNVNGAWSKVKSEAYGNGHVELWDFPDSGAGSVTVTVKGTNSAFTIAEYSGVVTSSPLDQMVGGSGVNTTKLSAGPTAAIGGAGELVIGIGGQTDPGSGYTAGTGFTLREQGVDDYAWANALEDMLSSSAVGQSMTMASAVSGYYGAIVAVLKPAPVTGGPTAALSVTPSSGAATLAVTASASGSTAGSHAISTYTFNFGDGTTDGPQATATATHSYTKGGVYAATVTVTDTAGLTSTATVTEYVGQPAAALSVVPSSGTAPLAVVADGGGSTDPTGVSSYTFNFGDGTTVGPQAGATAAHAYAVAGTYTVTLTVKDSSGASATSTATVTAAAAAGPETVNLAVPLSETGFDATGGTVSVGGTSCAAVAGMTCTISPSQITVSGLSVPSAGVAVVATVRALGSDSVCTQPVVTATVTDASTGLGGLGSTQGSICDGGLGVQQWWTFVSTALGPGGTAEVNAANGNVVVSQQDGGTMQLHGNLSLRIVRAYDSGATTSTGAQPVGLGWITSFVSAGDDLDGVALRVPTGERVSGGAAITLITDSGARDVFEPSSLATPVDVTTLGSTTGPLGPLVPTTLVLGAGYNQLCVDETYTAETGVHASMWRYVESSTGGCTGLTSSTAAVLGYATLTTDGVREEYNASGEVLSVRDALGNRVDFIYSGTQLTRVGETGGSSRSYTFSYTTWSGGVQVNITDPAGEVTEYQDNAAGDLINVLNPSGTSLHYTYGGCGGSATQICSAQNPDGNSVTFVYQASPFGGTAEISEVTDLLGTETAYTYGTNGAVQNAVTGTEEEHFAQVDALGRVEEVDEGSVSEGANGVWLKTTLFDWDTGCQQPDLGPNEDLCEVIQLSLDNGETPNSVTTYEYDDEGQVLVEDQSGTPSAVTTNQFEAQYVEASGAVNAFSDQIAGSGSVNSGTGPRRDSSTLFVLSDQTATLSPDGNAVGSGYSAHETTYTRDINSQVGAGIPVGSTLPCSGAGDNTGLLCTQTAPSKDGSHPTVTTYAYDVHGERTSMTTPDEDDGALTGSAYIYTYYSDTATGMSGTTHAGGWLEGVTDPTGEYVAYGYDAEGQVIMTWDRNATAQAGLPLSSYPGTCSLPAAPGYTETLYATSCAAAPGLYPVSETDALGNTATYQLDADGNQLGVRSPRGNQGGVGYPACPMVGRYDTCTTYNAAGEVLTVQQPVEATESGSPHTTNTYDAYGNLVQSTDAAGDIATATYDAVNRKITQTVGRYAMGGTLYETAGSDAVPTGCTTSTSAPWPAGGEVICTTSTTYDGEDNAIQVQAPASEVSDLVGVIEPTMTTNVYDSDHRLLETTSPRWDGTYRTLTSAQVYDSDGNVLEACPAREFTEGAGSCGAAGTTDYFSTYTAYNPADLPTTVTTYTANAPVTGSPRSSMVTTAYDADGNAVSTTNADGFTTTNTYNVLDKLVATTVPHSSSVEYTTSYGYDPSGNRIWTSQPPTSGAAPQSVTAAGALDNIVSYDADNRAVDTVKAAEDTTGTPNVCFNNFPSFGVTGTSACPTLGYTDLFVNASGTPTGGADVHSGVSYDADGNQVAEFSANAFQSSATTPNPEYMVRTDYDADDRPVVQYVPRYDTADPNATPLGVTTVFPSQASQAAECPVTASIPVAPGGLGPAATISGVPAYDATTGVCITAVQYNADAEVVTELLPAAGGTWSSPDQESFAYTADGLVDTVTSPNPTGSGTVQTTTVYDAQGNSLVTTEPNPDTASGQPATAQTVSTYSADSLLLTTTAPASQSLPLPLAGSGVGTASPDPADTQTFAYDAAGDQISSSDAYGATTVTQYTVDGRKQSLSAPAGGASTPAEVTAYTYDPAGNLLSVASPSATAEDATNPSGIPTTYTYTEDNLLSSTVTPPGSGGASLETDDSYSAFGQINAQHTYQVAGSCGPVGGPPSSGCDGGTIGTTYYLDGREASETPRTQANGASADTGATAPEVFTYDADGNETTATDVTAGSTWGATDTMTYYLDGTLRSTDDGASDAQIADDGGPDMAGYTAELSYDGAGNIATLTIARDGTPETESEAIAYNAAEDAVTLQSSASTEYYNPTVQSFGGVETRSYTPDGQLATQVQTDGYTTSYTYNPDGSVQQVWLCNFWSATTTSCGPTSQAKSSPSSALQWAWLYSYDSDGRLVASESTSVAAYGSPPPSTPLTIGQDTIMQYGYYPDGRVAEYELEEGAGLSQPTENGAWTSISYDHDGNRTQWSPTTAISTAGFAPTETFTYNPNDSLSQETGTQTTLTWTTSGIGSGTYEPTTTTAATSDTYDADGRLESDGCTTYTYDGFDQTLSASTLASPPASCGAAAAGQTTTYGYDALGRQATETDANGFWDTHYATTGSAVGVIQEGEAGQNGGGQGGYSENDYMMLLDQTGTPSQSIDFEWNASGSQSVTTYNSESYTNDGQGNVGAVVEAVAGLSGGGPALTCTLSYDIYGSPLEPTSASDPCMAPPSPGYDEPVPATPSQWTELGYQFAQRDATTGDYTFGNRSYDPSTAAFTTPDAYHPGSTASAVSVGADPLTADTYAYANADPVNLKDPDGHGVACDNGGSCGSVHDASAASDQAEADQAASDYESQLANDYSNYNDAETPRQADAGAEVLTNLLANTPVAVQEQGIDEMATEYDQYESDQHTATMQAGLEARMLRMDDNGAGSNAGLNTAGPYAGCDTDINTWVTLCPDGAGNLVDPRAGAGGSPAALLGLALGFVTFAGCDLATSGLGTVACFGAAGAVTSALTQYVTTGQVDPGEVALSAGIGVGAGFLSEYGAGLFSRVFSGGGTTATEATGDLSTVAENAAVHGNSMASQATTSLYQLSDEDGSLLKWGITNNPAARYTQTFMQGKVMDIIAQGSRADMATMERILTERVGGPLNLEPWAGTEYGNNMELVPLILSGGGG
jgi:RHS repeat-associated protein